MEKEEKKKVDQKAKKIAKETLTKEEEKKEDNIIEKNINSFFWIKIAGAAILFALGIWMLVDRDMASRIIVTATGVLVLVLSIARFIYVINAKNISKMFRVANIVELCLDLVIGVFLLICGIWYQANTDSRKKFVEFVYDNYRYFAGTVLYVRACLHFYSTAFFKVKSTIINYIINIIFITAGTFFIAFKFTLHDLSFVVAILLILSVAFFIYDGIMSYQKYKNGNNDDNARKSDEASDKKEKAIPHEIADPKPNRDQAVN